MNTIRKNITLPTAYETINNYVEKCGIPFMDSSEQEEIEAINIDFPNLNGNAVTLDELLPH